MTKATEAAVRAICAADASITQTQVKAAIAALDMKDGKDQQTDCALSVKEVAKILNVCPKTVAAYGRRGVIRGLSTGDKRGNIRRYSANSVKAFLAGKGGAE